MEFKKLDETFEVTFDLKKKVLSIKGSRIFGYLLVFGCIGIAAAFVLTNGNGLLKGWDAGSPDVAVFLTLLLLLFAAFTGCFLAVRRIVGRIKKRGAIGTRTGTNAKRSTKPV